MTPKYAELISFHQRRICADDDTLPGAPTPVTQTYRNQLSTLHSFLAHCGKSTEDSIGRELRTQFDQQLNLYIGSLTLGSHTKSDRRSHLRAWRDSVNVLLMERTSASSGAVHENPVTTGFHQLLRQSIAAAHEKPKTIAKRCGASTSAIQRWLKGAIPNVRAMPSLRRLEHTLQLDPGSLCALATDLRKNNEQSSRGGARIAYRERLKHNTQNPYLVRVDQLTPEFLAEWTAFFDYKTTKFPALARSSRGFWRLLPEGKIGANIPPEAYRHAQGCPAAAMMLQKLRAFFGFLALPASSGGYGLTAAEGQSLAWLAVPEAVNQYLEFISARSDGLIHKGQSLFAGFAACLTHPRTGYLTQQPAFSQRVVNAQNARPWPTMCEQTFKLCGAWKKAATQLSRDPEEPLRGLLALPEPLAPILRAVEILDQAAAAAPSGSMRESTCKRDALLLSMLVANPLRARNVMLMQYRDDQSGNLYCRQDGQWRLRFRANDFKNEKGAARGNYDAPLPRSLANRIVDYLDEFRPRLLRNNPDAAWVFPSSRTSGKWKDFSRQVFKIMRRLIPQTPGFGSHGMRHLVATDYLRKHPSDYPTVAELLHDRLETVLAVYAHMRQDDSFGRYEAHLDAIVR